MGAAGSARQVMADMRGYLKPEEIAQIYGAVKTPLEKILVRLLWRTGCRISELLAVKVGDVSWGDKMILIRTLKQKENRKERYVPVDNETLRLIKWFTTNKKSGLVIGSAFGWNPDDHKAQECARVRAYFMVRRIGARVGINNVGRKKLHPHHFRHSYAVAWVRTHHDLEHLRKLQQILGHADISMTAQYLQFGFKDISDDYEKVFKE